MRSIFVIIILLSFIIKSNCQQLPAAIETNIPVCCNLTESAYEFSGLTKWRNFLLLIPQHNIISDVHHIVAVDTLSIDSVLDHQSTLLSSYKIMLFDSSLNTVITGIAQAIGRHNKYGGFEAAVAVADTLFFTAETDSLCFVVKGIIRQQPQGFRVVFSATDTMALAKPDYKFANAGFESIAYLPASKRLVAFYENNNLSNAATAYSFTTNFTGKMKLAFPVPLPFRLTDITAIKDSAGNDALLGINYFYNDFKKDTAPKKTEFNYYLTGDTNKLYTSRQLSTAQYEMHNGNLLKDAYSRVIGMSINNNTVSWQEIKTIGYRFDNWEGITPYRNGVLLIIDGKPPGVTCRLSYFSLSANH